MMKNKMFQDMLIAEISRSYAELKAVIAEIDDDSDYENIYEIADRVQGFGNEMIGVLKTSDCARKAGLISNADEKRIVTMINEDVSDLQNLVSLYMYDQQNDGQLQNFLA